MKTKIYTDKRITNWKFEPDWQGRMPTVYIAEKNNKRGFGFTKIQAVENLKKILKLK